MSSFSFVNLSFKNSYIELPSIINYSIIDWFIVWPEYSLKIVEVRYLQIIGETIRWEPVNTVKLSE